MSLQQVNQAARHLQEAGVVMHATEGVWGLACDPFDEGCVARVLRLKRRPVEKGLIVIAAAADDFAPELDGLDAKQCDEILDTWPGAVTWVVPNRRFPSWITGKHATVAIRVPGHPQARSLCRAFGGPLVSTSANPAGEPSALSADQADEYFRAGVDYQLPGEVQNPGQPSQIRTLAGSVLRGSG